ncbi:hypothetical protein [Jatrophihabitans sp.]|uniref:hypothetical protein n=1 Tax=Jatrophihabitans sp. TaxID=1932789 RepID=UPI002CC6BFF5|nr:hypothetical protein [Jatrophihabitans sp.]
MSRWLVVGGAATAVLGGILVPLPGPGCALLIPGVFVLLVGVGLALARRRKSQRTS